MKKIDCLILQTVLGNNCNSSNGTTPDENAPGWHLIGISTEKTGHKVSIDGVEKMMFKCINTLPDVAYGLSSVTLLAVGGSLTFNVDDENNTLAADAELGLFVAAQNGDIFLISFNNEELSAELGVEPGTYFRSMITNDLGALAYYVLNE